MDKKQLAEIKTRIEEEIDKTRKSVIEYKEITKPIAPENAIGRVSRMDAINNKSVNEAALRQVQDKLKQLEYMITQVEQVDFGVCARCKRPIPIGRMLLMPHARHCVNCAS